MIVHLISLASSSAVVSPDLEEVRSRCRRLTQESAASRASLSLAESKLKQIQDQLEATEEATRRAEKKLDRERSRTVRELDAQGQGASTSNSIRQEPPADEHLNSANGDGTQATQLPAPAAMQIEVPNHTVPVDLEAMKELEDVRTRELEMLKDELLHRAHDLDMLQWKVCHHHSGHHILSVC